jgi:hypothetical protein
MPRSDAVIDERTITFHIIYMRGSVRLLFPLLQSLLHWSQCRLRLVGNGISEDEKAFLEAFVAGEPRTELLNLPTAGEAIHHGDALEFLLSHCTDDYFAFCDSDIVVDGPFADELLAALATADAVFGAAPVGMPQAARYLTPGSLSLYGQDVWDHQGAPIGGTFLTIIRRAALLRTHNDVPIGFRRCYWYELPAALRRKLADSGHRHFLYDTGRVLFSIMLIQGARFAWSEPATLHHLGGFSWRGGMRRAPSSRHGRGHRRKRNSLKWRLMRWLYRLQYRPSSQPRATAGDQKAIFHYFRELLEGRAVDGVQQPLSGDAAVDARVAAAGRAIAAARRLSR